MAVKKRRKKRPRQTAKEWCTSDNLLLIQGWARDGATMDELANNIGITRKTLYSWRKKYKKIDIAINQSKERVDYAVESALLKQAIKGNVNAQIAWLKNRKPEKWGNQSKEKRELMKARAEKAKAEAQIAKITAEQYNATKDTASDLMGSLTSEDLERLANLDVNGTKGSDNDD